MRPANLIHGLKIKSAIGRNPLLAILSVLIVVILIAAVAYVYAASQPKLPASCANDTRFTESDFSNYVCGTGSASDGRLSITVNNYDFSQGRDIPFQPPGSVGPSEVFLLVNATITNVGDGNTSIGPSFEVQVITSGGESTENGEYGDSVTFPNEYPNSSLPIPNGGVYLPPKASLTAWLLFYIPTTASANNQTTISLSGYALQHLMYREYYYGGDFSNGGFSCGPCQNPKVEFIITVPPVSS